MKKSDIAAVITMARAFDDRIEEVAEPYIDPADPAGKRVIEDARLTAWHMILGDIDVDLALQGLAELYRVPQMLRLQPGHIVEAAERVRRRNVAAADLDRLTPPQEIAGELGEQTREPEWRQAAIRAVGRGFSVEEAERIADDELRVNRRQLGPAVKRLELGERPAGMAPVRAMGETA